MLRPDTREAFGARTTFEHEVGVAEPLPPLLTTSCLLAVQRTAISYRWHRPTWQLAWTLNTFHHRRGHRYDRLAA